MDHPRRPLRPTPPPLPDNPSVPPPAARRRARLVGYFIAALAIGLSDHWLSCAPLQNPAGKGDTEANERTE